VIKLATQEEIERLKKAYEEALKRYKETDYKLIEAKNAYINTINENVDAWRKYREAYDAYYEAMVEFIVEDKKKN